MRYRELFTLLARKTRSGKKIYYYRAYDKNGRRTVARSTGQTSKSAPRAYCYKLYKKNRLISVKNREPLFSGFARKWWIYSECDYIKGRLARGFTISMRYADNQRMNLDNHILPEFKNRKLNEITSKMIENWLFGLKKSGLSNSTVNQCLSALRTMLKEAHRLGNISHNPAQDIKPLKSINKQKSILTIEEVNKLLDLATIQKIWISDTHYCANLLAACTGARLGEVQAMTGEKIFPGYVVISQSWDRKYELKSTKTNDRREIPVAPVVIERLEELKKRNPEGYLFSANGGETPLHYRSITDGFYLALSRAGIDEEQRKARNITFHSWRHFFNSNSRGQIEDYKMQLLTGHRTKKMTEHYTHLGRDDLQKLIKIQEGFIFSGPEEKEGDSSHVE